MTKFKKNVARQTYGQRKDASGREFEVRSLGIQVKSTQSSKGSQVKPENIIGLLHLKNVATDSTVHHTVEIQCDSEPTPQPIVIQSSIDSENKKLDMKDEMYKRIGRALCAIKSDTFPKIPTKKNIKNSGEEIMRNVTNVINIMRASIGEDVRHTFLKNMIDATSKVCGISRNTVINRTPEREMKPKKRLRDMSRKEKCRRYVSELPMLTRSRIIGRIHEMWRNGKDVTSEDLWKWSKENLSFTKGKTVFLHVLRGLGFLYKKKDHNTVVEERLDIIKRRGIYLNEKKKWDEKNAFYGSCDETWAHDGMVRRYGWQHSNGGNYKRARMSDLEAPQAGPQQGKERGKRIIVAAVLTEKGVLPGSELLLISGVNVDEQKADYHRDMDGDNFERYYKTIVPLLAAEAQKEGRPAVLIVDNAPYHCKAIKKPPTSGSSKQEIQAFLTENGLKFFKKQNRDVLYDLVKAFIDCNGGREAFTTYEFDEYAKSHGVTVLRLPQYHCFFNPVELLWSQLKQHLRKEGNTTDTAETVRTRALRFLQNFRDVSSKDLFAHTQKIEQDVREMSEERMLTLSEEHFDLLYDVDDEGRLINVTIDGDDVDNGDFFDSFCLSDDSSDDSFDDSDDDEELIIDYTEMV